MLKNGFLFALGAMGASVVVALAAGAAVAVISKLGLFEISFDRTF